MRPRFAIDADEWFQIFVSIMAITLSLTFATSGMGVEPGQFIFLMAIFGITVGSGFLLHELAHKYVAIRYGAHAKYKAWTFGLALMLGIAIIPQLLGFHFPLFLAPGAVMIYAMRGLSRKQSGIISIAGPVTNLILAGVFFALGIVGFSTIMFSGLDVNGSFANVLAVIVLFGVKVNIFLAFFNLLPIPPLDGSKVMVWDWRIWLLLFGISFLGMSIAPF